MQLTAVPAAGYVFVSWSGDLSGAGNPQSLVFSAPRSVTGTFTTGQPAISVTSGSLAFDFVTGDQPEEQGISVQNASGGPSTLRPPSRHPTVHG